MDFPETPFCSRCGKHPARYDFTIVKSGKNEIQPLCSRCYNRRIRQIANDEMAAVAAAHCNYCGAKATSRVSTIDAIIGGPGDRFACSPCFDEYHRFLVEHLNALDAMKLDKAKQIEALRQLYDETDAHTHQWVKQRDN
jgi:protein-arginine kinase activator protein McsA